MARGVLIADVGGRVRGRPRIGQMHGVKVAFAHLPVEA